MLKPVKHAKDMGTSLLYERARSCDTPGAAPPRGLKPAALYCRIFAHGHWVFLSILSAHFAASALSAVENVSTRPAAAEGMQVACVQLPASADIDQNARQVVKALEEETRQGTRLAVFSECFLTGYNPELIRRSTPRQIDAALKVIQEACKRLGIYAVVGSPYYEDGKRYNGALVIDPSGRIIKRYAKLHNVEENLFEEGNRLAIFRINGVPTTIMVCHDERYPEIFRIPVLAGAKIGIYISCESKTEEKWDNYRSQIMARAVENQITVIHCNAGDGGADEGSHGHSRIINSRGKILAEAGTSATQTIRAVIRPDESSNSYARNGTTTPSLQPYWSEGLRVLKEHNPEFFESKDSQLQN